MYAEDWAQHSSTLLYPCCTGSSAGAAPLPRVFGFKKNQMIMQEEYFQPLFTWKDGTCLGRRDSIF